MDARATGLPGRIVSLLLGVSTLLVGLEATASGAGLRENGCWTEAGAARLWPEIDFRPAADLSAYRQTFARTRNELRQTLEAELTEIVRQLGASGSGSKDPVPSVVAAILAFDELHQKHKAQAEKSVPAFLEAGVRAALDELYAADRIRPDQRRLRFARSGTAERLRGLRAEGGRQRKGRIGRQELEAARQVAETDLIAYGTFSADGTRLIASLTLQNVRTGALCDFRATGDLGEIPQLLARQVVDRFQSVEYAAIRNPNAHLTWIPPSPNEPVASAARARAYCAAQGAGVRLPHALELTTAASVGSSRTSYVEGGIPALEPGPWIVADRLLRDEQHYFFQPAPGSVDGHPLGPIRTGAGLAPVSGRYWCVRGQPDERIARIESYYALYRAASRTDGRSPVLEAVEYLLNREGALGARGRFATAYPDPQSALAVLEERGRMLAGGAPFVPSN